MFNLEKAISDWRQQMLAAGVKAPVPLEEMESHVREEIEQMVGSGFSEEEAFRTAIQKIGAAPAIQTEFKKVEASRKMRELLRLEIFFATFCILGSFGMGGDGLFQRGDPITVSQRMYCLAGLAIFALLVLGGRFSGQILQVIRFKQTRLVINLLHFALIGVWPIFLFRNILPLHQFTVTFIWGCIIPTGAMIGIYWGFIATSRKNPARTNS